MQFNYIRQGLAFCEILKTFLITYKALTCTYIHKYTAPKNSYIKGLVPMQSKYSTNHLMFFIIYTYVYVHTYMFIWNILLFQCAFNISLDPLNLPPPELPICEPLI